MLLAPGAKLGPYEILSPLGAGGMGEVYRARDSRLHREVAIKILRAQVTADPMFRERFMREARTISQLTHPHICTLYDVGEHEGAPYIVFEYLDGQTLAEWLARGPLKFDDALTIARQVLSGLDEAHRHGVVHRDLKPANVMLMRRGGSSGTIDARLLDFGLAKQIGLPRVGVDSQTSLQGPPTEKGAILGTVHYMAPEQLRGEEADARSDIFAFGGMLYEMLAGRRPFEATDSATLIAAILEREPPPFSGHVTIPHRLERIIRVCLEKSPDDRWQSSRDLLREMQWLTAESDVSPAAAAVARQGPSRRGLVAALVGGVLVAALGGWAWLGRGVPAAGNAIPVVVLMDSAHPARVYDPATFKAGGTNADDLTDLLRDLPLKLIKETTGTSWRREDQVLNENPDVIVVHRSCFFDSTLLGDTALDAKFFEQLYPPAAEKLEMLLAYVALANPRTRFVVYSRGSWESDQARDAWLSGMERRFPKLKGRLAAYKVPLDRATFRNAQTASEIRVLVETSLPASAAR
jgi:tRNA A-37 threonylcarbamoyl transferase component Bud32